MRDDEFSFVYRKKIANDDNALRWKGRWSQSNFSRLGKHEDSDTLACLKLIVKHLSFPLQEKGKFEVASPWS